MKKVFIDDDCNLFGIACHDRFIGHRYTESGYKRWVYGILYDLEVDNNKMFIIYKDLCSGYMCRHLLSGFTRDNWSGIYVQE